MSRKQRTYHTISLGLLLAIGSFVLASQLLFDGSETIDATILYQSQESDKAGFSMGTLSTSGMSLSPENGSLLDKINDEDQQIAMDTESLGDDL